MATFADALRSPAGHNHWRSTGSSMLGGVSGGVRCSLVTDHRSEPPPWWEPRPGTQPPQDTSDNPVFSSAGAALRARAVHQSLADPGSPPEESPRTSPHARGVAFPATPTSDCSFAHSQAGPRSATLPAGNGSPRQLNVKAHAFVPGTVVAPMAEVDLNEYIKQSVPVRSSPQVQSSGTLPPVENWTPSDEEDAEKQWREQIRRQMEVVGSAAVHSVHGASGRGPSELKHEVETASEEVRRDFPMIQQRPGLKDSPPVVPRVQVVSALSFVASALSRASMVRDLGAVPYPQGIRRADSSLNRGGTKGRFWYNRDFLLQFKDVCNERPTPSPHADAALLDIIMSGGERSPSHNAPRPWSRRKQWPGSSPAACTVGLAFGTTQAIRGSDNVRIAPTALQLAGHNAMGHHPRRTVLSPQGGRTCDSPTVSAGTNSEGSESALTVYDSVDNPQAGNGTDEKRREARFDELERQIASLVREVESLRREVVQLKAN